MCAWCFPGNVRRCGVCSYGYVLTDDWQCMKNSSSMEAKPFLMSEAERWNTLKVLQAFAAAMPSLRWSGGDFCSWSGVRCLDANVSIVVTRLWVTGTLPEMPDDVDYSMVRLDEIHVFGEYSGITGTLPKSWGKLQRVRAINLGYTSISGTLPAAWSSMAAIEQIILSTTQISGTLPEAWSSMRNLRRIYLDECNLHGSLPESWADLPSLEHLSLYNNNFCGCVPEAWLTSTTLLMAVDARHRMGDCARAEACVETTTTTPRPTSNPFCHVPNCLWCFTRDSTRCSVCVYNYRLTRNFQCVKSIL
ncbi:hypothetical protein, unknown function [Leishmania tarentolae]|uniref:Surface antigen-like protein n=1 Tax=Leishmania tarentolae TaxID=5689 RepID=A0A640KW86_LEITA|nr:hypothetical protein, unknown function [Leishmania tarentolae]